MMKRLDRFFLKSYTSVPEEFRRGEIILRFLFISILFALGYLANSYLTGFLMARYVMAITIVVFSLQLLGLRAGLPLWLHAQIFLLCCWLIVACLSFASGGIQSGVLPWTVLVPVAALILTDRVSVFVWTVLNLFTIVLFYFVEPGQYLDKEWVMPHNPLLMVTLYAGLVLIILWMTKIFDARQRALIRQIEDQKNSLQAADEELRQSLEELSATQESLQEKEAESRSIVEALRKHYHITEFDLSGTITYANEQVAGMTGQNPVGLNRFDHMDPEQRPSRLDAWERIINGQSQSQESRYVVNGHEFWVMSTYAPIVNRMNQVARIMSVAHNITDSKKQALALNDINNRLKEALGEIKTINETLEHRVKVRTMDLEEKNKRLAEYAFINSHLLRAPLCRLLGLIQLLELSQMPSLEPDLLNYLRHSGEELDAVVKKINLAIESGSDFDRREIGRD